MAIWGMGVMLGPIMGPTLGGLADRQLFLALGVPGQPAGRHRDRHRPDDVHGRNQAAGRTCSFDWFGFLALAVGIGSLQLMLDRGEQLGWFESPEIWIEAIVSAIGLLLFLRAFADDE